MTRTPAEPLADGEMIEKVARAMIAAEHAANAVPTDEYLESRMFLARAAITAYNPNERLREALEDAVAYIRWLADGDSDTIVHAGTLRAKSQQARRSPIS